MNIEFEFVDFHQSSGSLQVKYFNQDLPDGVMFSINLPLVDGQYPQGDALVSLINSYAPQDIFERAATIRAQGPATPKGVPAPAANSIDSPQLFRHQQLFVQEGNERVLLVRPLVQSNNMGIPIEVL